MRHLIFLVCLYTHAAPLTTILGRPDSTQEFVHRLVQKQIPISTSEEFETVLSTKLYSILEQQGVQGTVSIEVMSPEGTVSLWQALRAIMIARSQAPVVLWIFRGETGSNNDICREMAGSPETAFVFPAGSDGSGNALDPINEPHCLSKNILFVTALDQNSKTLASFSNYGEGVRLAAPGVSLPVVGPGGSHATLTGVSPALAIAASQLSRYQLIHPELQGEDLIASFLQNATLSLDSLEGKVEGNHVLP